MDISRNKCPICLNNIILENAVLTSCNHRFCSVCFFTWINTSHNCPVCRYEFFEKPLSQSERAEQELLLINLQNRIEDSYHIMTRLNRHNDIIRNEYRNFETKYNLIKEKYNSEINRLHQLYVSYKQKTQRRRTLLF